ncbi:MAG: hypothetical protein U9O89_08115, partial [Thermoproteota archaeon]|nr:hypothetical protein [Thermoproteota archaeon]
MKTLNKTVFTLIVMLILSSLIISISIKIVGIPTVYGINIPGNQAPSVGIYVNTTGFWRAGYGFNKTGWSVGTSALQAAVDNCTASDTYMNITVLPGTYNVTQLNVDVTGMTLQAYTSTKPTINYTQTTGQAVTVTADDVIIDGFTITGPNITSGFIVQLITPRDNVTIRNSVINSTGGASQGISTCGTYSNLTIQNNTFYVDSTGGDVGVTFNPSSSSATSTDVIVTQNIFVSSGGATNAMKFGSLKDSSITYNTINGTNVRLHIVNADTNNVTLAHNTWNGINNDGLLIQGYQATKNDRVTNLDINSNTFKDLGYSILFFNSTGNYVLNSSNLDANTIHIYYNNFENVSTGTAPYKGAVVNQVTSVIINATLNWWGDTSGPGGVGVAGGAGNQVSSHVNYSPWLNSSYPGGSAIGGTGTSDSFTAGGTLDAMYLADTMVEISGTGSVEVGVVKFFSNPVGPSFSGDIGTYIDVNINTTTGVNSLLIKLHYTEGAIDETVNAREHAMYWWNGTSWQKCSDTGINTVENLIWVRITDSTSPNLNGLTDTPFGANSLSHPVGGIFPPENRL